MGLRKNQESCKCGKSVKTLDDVWKNGHIKIVGKTNQPHIICNSCGIDWGKFS